MLYINGAQLVTLFNRFLGVAAVGRGKPVCVALFKVGTADCLNNDPCVTIPSVQLFTTVSVDIAERGSCAVGIVGGIHFAQRNGFYCSCLVGSRYSWDPNFSCKLIFSGPSLVANSIPDRYSSFTHGNTVRSSLWRRRSGGVRLFPLLQRGLSSLVPRKSCMMWWSLISTFS